MPPGRNGKKGQHNPKHENGLVGPGKRVSKQKSNGQLNSGRAQQDGQDESTQPLPNSLPLLAVQNFSAPSSAAESAPYYDQRATGEEMRYAQKDSDTDSEDVSWDKVNGTIDSDTIMGLTQHLKHKSSFEFDHLGSSTTIVPSWPAGDTIAILIVLLAIPEAIILLIQGLFAYLTIFPPTGSAQKPLLSYFDVFQGASGSPAASTMLIVDSMAFIVWYCFWPWAQKFLVDLSKISVALMFMGGTSGKNTSTGTFCSALIAILNLVRSKKVREFFSTRFLPATIIQNPHVAKLLQYLPGEGEFDLDIVAPNILEGIFAMHIIAQASAAWIRRNVSPSASTSTSKASRKHDDTESAAHTGNESTAFEPADRGTATPPSMSTTASSVTPGKIPSSKKRRRHPNLARGRQPFWAALASAKLQGFREQAQSNTTGRRDGLIQPSAAVETQHHVCIVAIESTSIHFETTSSSSFSGGIKPFYIRINNAKWHTVTFDKFVDDSDDEDFPTRWSGMIGGLAPDCNYTCKFIQIGSEQVMAEIMVKTPAMKDHDLQKTVATVPLRASARPNSPTSSLRTSIESAERQREDAINKRNRLRTNHKKSLHKLDKDIEAWHSKLKSGSDDHRLRSKLLQAERSSKQHEEHTMELCQKLDGLQVIPEEGIAEYDDKRAAFDKCNQQLAEANEILVHSKSETSNDLRSVKNELSQIQGRREKLVSKNSKLTSEQEQLTQANEQNISEQDRRRLDSEHKTKTHQEQETEWRRRIKETTEQRDTVRAQNLTLWHDIEAQEAVSVQAREALLRDAGPLTPEGELPGTQTNPQLRFQAFQPATNSSFSPFIPDPHASPFTSFSKPVNANLPNFVPRARSNTNQSAHSQSRNMLADGDMDDADPIPPMLNHMNDFARPHVENGRQSSGSSRGHHNHSPLNPSASIGVIGGGFRSPQHGAVGGNHSPGQDQPQQAHGHTFAQRGATNTW